MTIKDLKQEAFNALTSFPFIRKIEIVDEDRDVIKVRLIIRANFFLQAFLNMNTGTTNFVAILNGKRIFGRDTSNIKGWHKHPFDDPDAHDFSGDASKSVTLTEFLYEFQKIAFEKGLI